MYRFNRLALGALVVSAIVLTTGLVSEAESVVASSVSGPSGLATNGASVTQAGAKGEPDSTPSTVGINATFVEDSQHDASTGWSFVLTPDLSFHLNRHFFIDGSVPWYQSLQASVPTTVNGVTAELAIPLTQRITLAGNYNRSFIQANAIAGFSLTWQLRTPKKADVDAPAYPVNRLGN